VANVPARGARPVPRPGSSTFEEIWAPATHVDVTGPRADSTTRTGSQPVPRGAHYPREAPYGGYQTQAAGQRRRAAPAGRSRKQPERGLPGWLALVILLAISGIGGLIDTISGSSVKGGFSYGLILASAVAILVVRRHSMFPIVIAPPIVYFVASGAMLYIRSGGLHNRKILLDAAANWLVYGFPAIAGASAVVLIVAGIRILIKR
jgi:hypothetical protein